MSSQSLSRKYCRCGDSQKSSQGKRQGSGNPKNGNKYLAWALVAAANFAIRSNPRVKRFYQRKNDQTNGMVALKAVAHQLAVINRDAEEKDDLLKDLVAIITSFCCRLYGVRRGQRKAAELKRLCEEPSK